MIAYDDGLKVDLDNKGLQEGRKNALKHAKETEKGFANFFGFPDLWEKLEKHPTTRKLLKDQEYKELVEFLQARPNDVVQHLGDSRITATLQAMIQLEENGGEMPEEVIEIGVEAPAAAKNASSILTEVGVATDKKEASISVKEASPVSAAVPTSAASVSAASTEEEWKKLKEAGNAAYKKKEFDEALRLYESSFVKDSTNMTILSNMAAVLLEKGDFDACIAKCHEAVDVGRENRAGVFG